jgi:hypothetical protein
MKYFCTVLFAASVTDCHRPGLLDILAELTCDSSNLSFMLEILTCHNLHDDEAKIIIKDLVNIPLHTCHGVL